MASTCLGQRGDRRHVQRRHRHRPAGAVVVEHLQVRRTFGDAIGDEPLGVPRPGHGREGRVHHARVPARCRGPDAGRSHVGGVRPGCLGQGVADRVRLAEHVEHGRDAERERLPGRAGQEVHVGVDQPGHEGPAVGVDVLVAGPAQGVVADGVDAPVREPHGGVVGEALAVEDAGAGDGRGHGAHGRS
jgi:hypothetical protein